MRMVIRGHNCTAQGLQESFEHANYKISKGRLPCLPENLCKSAWPTLPITYKLVTVDTEVGSVEVSNNSASGPISQFFNFLSIVE